MAGGAGACHRLERGGGGACPGALHPPCRAATWARDTGLPYRRPAAARERLDLADDVAITDDAVAPRLRGVDGDNGAVRPLARPCIHHSESRLARRGDVRSDHSVPPELGESRQAAVWICHSAGSVCGRVVASRRAGHEWPADAAWRNVRSE